MFTRVVLALLVCSASASSYASKVKVNPIRKITGLLENMQKEIEEQGAKEQVLYDNFMCFCDNGAADLLKTANDAEAANKAAAAQLEADTAEKAQLESDIKTHTADLASAQKDLEEATNIRDKSKAEFDATVATKSSSEGALGKAIPAIEKGMGGAALMEFVGDAAFKQIKRAIRSSQRVTGGNRESISSFLQGEASAPGSSEILGMLKSMNDELTRDMTALKKDEESALKGFADMKASKEKEVEFADESIESKKERVGTLAVEIVKNKDAVEDSAAEAAAAKKFAATLDEQCAAKKKEWAETCKMRAEELAGIGEAISILTDDDALDVFKKTLPAAALVQGPASVPTGYSGHRNMFTGEMTFLQARQKPAQRLQKAQALISQASSSNTVSGLGLMFFTLRSKMRLAENSQGAVDFTEIFKVIDEMIAILTKDNKDDATQKDLCIAELTKTEAEKAATDDKLNSLAAQISEVTDGIATVAEKITSLGESIATTNKDVAEATEERKKEHELFGSDLSANEVAVALIGKAKNRLQKFYNPTLYKAPPKKEMTMEEKIIKAGTFVQRSMDDEDTLDMPEAPASPALYQKSEKSAGVIGLMDMMIKEIETDMKDAEYEEKTSQSDYAKLMADSEETRAANSKGIVSKTASKAQLEAKLDAAKDALTAVSTDLDLIASTLGDLHMQCDFLLQNYDP